MMQKLLSVTLVLACLFSPALGAEGDPFLSVDELGTLQESYEPFLRALEELLLERGLLREEDREEWLSAQLGDFYQNGGYGSILIQYSPDVLGLVREEDTMQLLSVHLSGGSVLEVSTMRRYTPSDSALSGLMLTMNALDEQGAPLDVHYTLRATGGIFLKWDNLSGAYDSVGTAAVSEGESVVWSLPAPAEGADDPQLTITAEDALTGEARFCAQLVLTVEGESYLVGQDALTERSLSD